MNNELTVVFGFSDNPERYSNKAFSLLKQFEHQTFPFNPRVDDINNIPKKFHTLTMYVNREISSKFAADILKLDFKRIIFNPGAENPDLEELLKSKKIEIVHGCTLVMLKTDQY